MFGNALWVSVCGFRSWLMWLCLVGIDSWVVCADLVWRLLLWMGLGIVVLFWVFWGADGLG